MSFAGIILPFPPKPFGDTGAALVIIASFVTAQRPRDAGLYINSTFQL